MSTPKFAIVFLLASLLLSCSKRYKLSEDDYKWMPYRGNETLAFASNTGEKDTIFLLKKDTLIAYPEAQSLFGITYEQVSIFCKHSDPASPDGQHRYLQNPFLELEKSKDKKVRLQFRLLAKDACFYKLSGTRLDSLDKQKPIRFQTAFKEYIDVYVIEDEDWLNFKQRSDYITKLYWSKSQGLIRYDKQNGDYWELANKYSR